MGEADFFWEANGRSPFPDAASEVDVQVQKYKQVSMPALQPPRPQQKCIRATLHTLTSAAHVCMFLIIPFGIVRSVWTRVIFDTVSFAGPQYRGPHFASSEHPAT